MLTLTLSLLLVLAGPRLSLSPPVLSLILFSSLSLWPSEFVCPVWYVRNSAEAHGEEGELRRRMRSDCSRGHLQRPKKIQREHKEKCSS